MSHYSNSKYEGDMKDGWYHGKGIFTYPSGVSYEGQFDKGQFNGKGVLTYPNGGKYIGVWDKGKKVSGDYLFFDDLKFEEKEWDYCTGTDRRFNYERNNQILPSGQTALINGKEREKAIPAGTYDIGEGYFDPIRCLIYNYGGDKLLRTPDEEEVTWIVKNCRYEPRKTEKELTGAQDEVIMRVMELQEQDRRTQAEQLMKEGSQETELLKKEAELAVLRNKAFRERSMRGWDGVTRERSFIMIKPDGVARGMVGKIIEKFENKGFKMVAMKLVRPDETQFKTHYNELVELPFFPDLLEYMLWGPVCAMVWEGNNVILTGRKILGKTKPVESEPGTIRGNYGITTGRNIAHGSDSEDSSKREIDLWFTESEIEKYTNMLECRVFGVN